jgi:hypothetical protein
VIDLLAVEIDAPHVVERSLLDSLAEDVRANHQALARKAPLLTAAFILLAVPSSSRSQVAYTDDMERSAVDRSLGSVQSGDSRGPDGGGEPRPEPMPHVKSVTLPPFFAVSPGLKQAPARLRALLGRAAHKQ